MGEHVQEDDRTDGYCTEMVPVLYNVKCDVGK